MKVLILGGTVFLSAAVARAHLDAGHDVTCLSRSSSGAVPEGAAHVVADRARGLDAYRDVRAQWDCVVDVATDPRFARDALDALGANAGHWTYVSSCSVYVDQDTPHGDESRATFEPLTSGVASSPDNYGAAKAASEAACHDVRGADVFIVRPGLIVGPGDPSDRGGYWPARFARDATPVLAPRGEGLFCQVIHVDDLARWLVRCAQRGVTGVMNAVGEARAFSEVLETTRQLVGSQAEVVRVADQWLLEQGVTPWAGPDSLPLWIPLGQGFDGFTTRSRELAQTHGLAERALDQTVRDILGDERSRGLHRERSAGLTPARESSLLAHWRGE